MDVLELDVELFRLVERVPSHWTYSYPVIFGTSPVVPSLTASTFFLFAVPDSRLEPALILLVGGYRTKLSSTSVFCFRVLISNLPIVFRGTGKLGA